MKIQGNFKILAFVLGLLFGVVTMLTFTSVVEASVGVSRAEMNRGPSSKKSRAKMKRAIRPSWSQSAVSIDHSNDSYLTSTHYVRSERTINDDLFAGMDSKDFESTSRAYEVSKLQGGENSRTEKSRLDSIREYARRAMDKISKFHLKTQFKHAKKYAESMDSGAREPLAAAIIATSLYTGRTFNLRIAEGVKLSSRTELKDKHASVAMHLPGAISSQVETNPGTGVTATLSKQITNQISASVGTKDRGTAQVNYSLSF